jgi:hypothetical protein
MTEFDDEADMDEGTVIGANTLRKKFQPVPSRQQETPTRHIPIKAAISPRMKVRREEPTYEDEMNQEDWKQIQ